MTLFMHTAMAIILLVCALLYGCAVTEAIEYGLAGDGYNRVQVFWKDKPTPYLIKHLKRKSNDLDYFQNFKNRMDYEVIVDLLKKRADEKGVCECFQEIREKTRFPRMARDMDESLALCHEEQERF